MLATDYQSHRSAMYCWAGRRDWLQDAGVEAAGCWAGKSHKMSHSVWIGTQVRKVTRLTQIRARTQEHRNTFTNTKVTTQVYTNWKHGTRNTQQKVKHRWNGTQCSSLTNGFLHYQGQRGGIWKERPSSLKASQKRSQWMNQINQWKRYSLGKAFI